VAASDATAAPEAAHRLPRPVLVAEPPPDRRPDRRRAPPPAPARRTRRDRPAGRRALRPGRSPAGVAIPLPARALRRAAAARRLGASTVRLPVVAGRGRAGLGPGRIGPGVDPQPPARPAAGPRLLVL